MTKHGKFKKSEGLSDGEAIAAYAEAQPVALQRDPTGTRRGRCSGSGRPPGAATLACHAVSETAEKVHHR
jgi:hypothetical protein